MTISNDMPSVLTRLGRLMVDRPIIPLILLLIGLVGLLEIMQPGIFNQRWLGRSRFRSLRSFPVHALHYLCACPLG